MDLIKSLRARTSSIPQETITFGWVALALLASSIEPLIVKLGYRTGSDPVSLLAWKLIFGGIFMLPLMVRNRDLPKQKIPVLLWIGACFSLHYLAVFYALTRTSASILVTFLASTPALVALMNQMKMREKAGRKFWFWWAACFFGVLLSLDLFGTAGVRLDGPGIALCGTAVALSALYRVSIDHFTRGLEPLTVSGAIFAIAGIVGLALIPVAPPMNSQGYFSALWMGLAGAAANIAFVQALKSLGSTRISVLTLLQRPLVIFLAAILLEEPLGALQVAGVALVILGSRYAKVEKRV